MVKNGYYANRGSNFAWDLGVVLLGVRNVQFGEVKRKMFRFFDSKDVMEKYVSRFLVYPSLRIFQLAIKEKIGIEKVMKSLDFQEDNRLLQTGQSFVY